MIRTILYALAGLLVAAGTALAGGNTNIDSYSTSRKLLLEKVYYDHRITIYCNSEFAQDKTILKPFQMRDNVHQKRAGRMEWEHAVPVENFGRAFREWREGDPQCVDKKNQPFKGRKCAELASSRFRYMLSDMYNLYPSVGSINALRSNFQFSELPWEPPYVRQCPVKIKEKRFEPPDHAKGTLARTCLYMDAAYTEYKLSKQQRKLFEAWDKRHPVDRWECTRAMRIERLQGNENPFVKRQCLKAGMWW